MGNSPHSDHSSLPRSPCLSSPGSRLRWRDSPVMTTRTVRLILSLLIFSLNHGLNSLPPNNLSKLSSLLPNNNSSSHSSSSRTLLRILSSSSSLSGPLNLLVPAPPSLSLSSPSNSSSSSWPSLSLRAFSRPGRSVIQDYYL